MFWLQVMKSFNITLCSGNKKKIIWLHLAQVTYLPQRVKMIWCSSWIKRPNALCVLQAVDGVCSENRADAGIMYPMVWSVPLIPPKTCSNSRPWRIWMLSRRLIFSILHISHTWQCEHPRKVKIGWPAILDVTGKIPELYLYSPEREQITRNDLAFSEQALQMGLDSSPEMGSKGEMCLMKPDNKSDFNMDKWWNCQDDSNIEITNLIKKI